MPAVTLKDGAHLAYDVYDFTDPWSNPETVVLVHGFSKNRRYWYKWIPPLASRYRVVCVDQRAHGDSSMPPDDFEMALAPFAADLNEFAGVLELEPAHWVMAEFTTAVAVEFAIRHPGRLSTLVLAGFCPRLDGVDLIPWAELAEKEGSEAWARETNRFRLGPDADPRLKEWYVTQQARVPAAVLAKVFRYAAKIDLLDRVPLIATPTLVIAGQAAGQTKIETVERAVRLMPNCELAALPGAPFNVMNDRPAESVAATLAFLEKHRGRN